MTATIQPEKILKELANLWIENAAPSESNQSGVLRACSMTMRFFSTGLRPPPTFRTRSTATS